MNTNQLEEPRVLQLLISETSALNGICWIKISKTVILLWNLNENYMQLPGWSAKSVYNIYNMTGIRDLTKFLVKFRPLNEHRFRHNFDCLSPLCVCGTGSEDSEHLLLHCPLFDLMRTNLFSQLAHVPALDITSMIQKICVNYFCTELNIGMYWRTE